MPKKCVGVELIAIFNTGVSPSPFGRAARRGRRPDGRGAARRQTGGEDSTTQTGIF